MSFEQLISRVTTLLLAAICTLHAGVPPAAADPAPLPMLGVDGSRVSVSGVSSGAYMAVQFHVAFSDEVMGAGVVAGGPYNCAQGLATYALQRCMDTTLGRPDGAELFREARRLATRGHIDATANLADDRVYIFAGARDDVVDPRVVAETADFYRAAGLAAEHIAYVDDIGAGHGFVTTDHGLACAATGAPFINDCDYDQAGAILAAMYGNLQPPSASLGGRILPFDQGAFISRPRRHSMGDTGYVYIPAACEQPGAACRLHVAFHGCRQSTADIGDQFYASAGYNGSNEHLGWLYSRTTLFEHPKGHFSTTACP